MVVDHADRLHIGITDRCAEEFEPALFHVLTDGVGDGGGGDQLVAMIDDGFPVGHVTIQIVIEAPELLLDLKEQLRRADGCADLEFVADDAIVIQEPLEVRFSKSRDLFCIEISKRLPVVVTSSQDRDPTQPGLGRFEDEELEQLLFIMGGFAPFFVVILDIERVVSRPMAPDNRGGHFTIILFVRKWGGKYTIIRRRSGKKEARMKIQAVAKFQYPIKSRN